MTGVRCKTVTVFFTRKQTLAFQVKKERNYLGLLERGRKNNNKKTRNKKTTTFEAVTNRLRAFLYRMVVAMRSYL